VSLVEELNRIAGLAAEQAREGETLGAVLPTEPHAGVRVYLVGLEEAAGRVWVALDADGRAIGDRSLVRAAVSIAALCELAAETAVGGDLDELRRQLVAVRMTQQVPGIEAAEEALDELQRVVGSPPQLASPERLDAIAEAARRLEQELGETTGSPFAAALQAGTGVVDELVRDVEAAYRGDLS
jgi:hypothetical protein